MTDQQFNEDMPHLSSSEVRCPRASRPEPDGDEKWRMMFEQQNQNFLALLQAMSPASNKKVQLPEFDPEKPNVDARAWVTTADMCMADCELQGASLMITLSRALKGQASSWLSQISFPGMTWNEFKDLFVARYDCPETPAASLINLNNSAPKEGECFAAYSSRVLTSLMSRWKNLTVEQIAISTVLAHMSHLDHRVQRLAFTTDIDTRSKLQQELRAMSFLKRKNPFNQGAPSVDSKHFKPNPTTSAVKCYVCGKAGHKASTCYQRRDSKTDRRSHSLSSHGSTSSVPAMPKDTSSVTCFRCKSRGHYANRCPAAAQGSGSGGTGVGAGAVPEQRRVDLCVVNAPTGILHHSEMIEGKEIFLETKPNKSDETKEDVVLEKILSKFRPLGPYYLRFMPFLIFACMSNALYCMNYVFAVVIVDYRCKYPECENSTSWSQLTLNLTRDTCYKYQLHIDDYGTCSVDSYNVSNAQKCQEWVYEEPLSFVADFDLGCQDWKRALVGTVHSFGYMLGLLLLGPISDKIGRKKLIVFTGVTGAIMGLARSVAVSYWAYVAFELVEALLGDGYSPNYMLGVEMVAKENRALFAPLMIGSMSVGGMLMALTAWLIPYWRHFLRVIYAPALIFIFYAFFLDESVRWLLIKGRKKEAKDILRRAAKISNVYVDESTLDKIKCGKGDADVNLISLLKMTITSRTLLLRLLACACAWITATFNKYCLLINSVSLEGNKYVNYALTSFADLPASLLLVIILIKFKRKKPLMFSFLMTGLFCIVQSLVPKGYPMLSTSLFFAGKFMSALSSGTVYLYTTELFPTYTRNTMHALCSSIGRIGSILAPQTTLLLRYWSGFPSLIIGGLSLTTALIVMMMPDTADDVLPDTVQQAEVVGSKRVRTDDGSVTRSLL